MKKERRLQLTLISIGFLLFVTTYLYYPNLNKHKLEKEFTNKQFKEVIG